MDETVIHLHKKTISKPRYFWRTKKGGVIITAILLSIPALAGIIIFYYLPIFEAVRYSFYNYELISRSMEYSGVDNYTRMFNDRLFFASIKATFHFFTLKVPMTMAVGLGLALLVRSKRRGIGILRTIILLPTVTSMVVVTIVWGFMYHPQIGLFNSILNSLGLPSQKFLTSSTQAMPSIVAITLWKDVGITMLFYLAGLLGIPEEYYDAAKIDGANSWQQLIYITLPSLRGTNLFILITTTIGAFRVFIPVYLTTKGGPMESTSVVMMMIYNYAFKFNEMGYSAALTVVLAITLIIVSGFQFYVTRKKSTPNKTRSNYRPDRVPYI